MATAKKSTSKKIIQSMSWRNFFFAASVTLNIAFVVLFITMATTNALDGLLMREGLTRYCAEANDESFADNPVVTRGIRDFTCAKGDAKDDFEKAVNNYLESKGLQ